MEPPVFFSPEFNREILPSPAMERCWFCRTRSGECDCEYTFLMHKIFARQAMRRPVTGSEIRSALIPRCRRCRTLHLVRKFATKMLGVCIGLGTGIVSLRHDWPALLWIPFSISAGSTAQGVLDALTKSVFQMEGRAWSHPRARALASQFSRTGDLSTKAPLS